MSRIFIPNPEFQDRVLLLIANAGIACLAPISFLQDRFKIGIPGVKSTDEINVSKLTLVDPDRKRMLSTSCKDNCKTVIFAKWLEKQPKRYNAQELLKKAEKYGFTKGYISLA